MTTELRSESKFCSREKHTRYRASHRRLSNWRPECGLEIFRALTYYLKAAINGTFSNNFLHSFKSFNLIVISVTNDSSSKACSCQDPSSFISDKSVHLRLIKHNFKRRQFQLGVNQFWHEILSYTNAWKDYSFKISLMLSKMENKIHERTVFSSWNFEDSLLLRT